MAPARPQYDRSVWIQWCRRRMVSHTSSKSFSRRNLPWPSFSC